MGSAGQRNNDHGIPGRPLGERSSLAQTHLADKHAQLYSLLNELGQLGHGFTQWHQSSRPVGGQGVKGAMKNTRVRKSQLCETAGRVGDTSDARSGDPHGGKYVTVAMRK